MKTFCIQLILILSPLALPTLSQADPPAGVGAADITRTSCFVGFVDIGGDSTPILPGGEGLVFVNLADAVAIRSNDRNGNEHLRCHGRLPLGETVPAVDFITGVEILATLPTVAGACAAIDLVFPEACRGHGAILFNLETTGVTCSISGVPAPDWQQVVTRNGATNLSCHILP